MRLFPRITLSILILILSGTCALCQKPATPAPTAPPQGAATNQPRQDGGSQRHHSRSRGGSGGENGQYSMDFENADIQSVVKFLSMISNVPIVVDPDLKGNVTIVSSKQLTIQESYEVINAALRVRGYSMVGGLESKVIRVISGKKAIVDSTGVVVGKELADGVEDQDLVTQVVALEHASSDTLRDQLRPLVSSDEASLVSIDSNNTLIITDHASNMKRLMEIIKRCDTDTTGLITVNVYQCRYASADTLVTTLNALFQQKQTGIGGGPSANGQGTRGGRNTGAPGADPTAATLANNGGLAALRGQINITSDARTNRLIISASPDRICMVLEVVKQLDVDTLPEVKVKCFPLQYADAQTTSDQLNSMFEQPQGGNSSTANSGRGFNFFGGGGNGAITSTAYAGLKRNVVVADVRTNSIIVTATDQNMKAFESIIKELDTCKVLSEVTRVYPLKYAKAADLASSLTSLFRGSNSTGFGSNYRQGGIASIFGLGSNSSNNNSPLLQLQQITVVAEPKTNSLLVTGPPNAGPLMDQIVAELDKRTAQVFIEAAIVDVTLDKDTQFGVEWQWHDAQNSAVVSLGVEAQKTGLQYTVIANNLKAILHAFQTRNDVKVLSTPTITTADNVQAKISIGTDVPILNSTLTSGGNQINTVTYQNVSIALTVTPHVNGSSDVIGLDVHQLINEITGTDPATDAPIIADREALTSITVKDGQTIVIGGIIQETKTKEEKAVPIFSSIPLIGNFFKNSDWRKQKTELMVFLTPRILKTEDDVQEVTSNTEKRLTTDPPPGTASLGVGTAKKP